MSDNIPQIKPIKVTEYETKQSKYEMVPNLPVRSITLGSSGSGKNYPFAEHGLRYISRLF